MPLKRFTVRGFQSYRSEQTVDLDPRLTLLAGRNDVGKSALLRAMQILTQHSQGAHPDAAITFSWAVNRERVLELTKGRSAPEHPEWLGAFDPITISVTMTPVGVPSPPRGEVQKGQFRCSMLGIEETGLTAVPLNSPTDLIWENGPFQNSDAFTQELLMAVTSEAARVAYLAPRRIQQGRTGTQAQSLLTPDGNNLTSVIIFLKNNHPTTLFRQLEAFLQDAFPQIETITPLMAEDQQMAELHVLYRDAPDRPIPLALCGTGIEQMLALGASVLTNQDPRLFLIDEPQAYLHPHAERSLGSFLESNPQHQYVIATHSAFFLTSRPLSQARLVTMIGGDSQILQLQDRAEVLAELGLTASDLWLSEHVLWVEGASEVGVVERLFRLLPEFENVGVTVKAMPTPSRFSARGGKQAEAAFEFCAAAMGAIAPMPVEMLFLFDGDEKSTEVKDRLTSSSDGRARFLIVRELENLLLDPEAVATVLGDQCAELGLERPSSVQIAEFMTAELSAHDDTDLFPNGFETGSEESAVVVGSRVLARVYWRFLTADYRKVDDGPNLAEAVFRHRPEQLEPLLRVMRELVFTAGQ